MKASNVIKFYSLATKLKDKIRQGWLEIGIETEHPESVADHIYGTLILAIAVAGEYSLDLDMYKVLRMLTLHELEEIIIPDYTSISHITREEKLEQGRRAVHQVTEGLIEQGTIEELLEEFNAHKTKESQFAFQIDKLECDLQAKLYDLEGKMSFEKVQTDAMLQPNKEEIIANARTASDIWIEIDRPKYLDDFFLELLDCIENYDG